MRIRLPFAGAFATLLLFAAYLGLSSVQIPAHLVNDKVLHTVTFFILTTCFYWILDTSRRRNLNLTLLTITFGLGIGSEFLQGFLPNGRTFDAYDILANVVGSLAALGLNSLYHKRMLERKRAARGLYGAIPGEDIADADLELGEGLGGSGRLAPQESGIVPAHIAPPATPTKSLEAEVDGWDENQVDVWDEDEQITSGDGEGGKTPSASSAGGESADKGKKRAD